MAIFNGKIHYKLPFSIAMLVYQRVDADPVFLYAYGVLFFLALSAQLDQMCCA